MFFIRLFRIRDSFRSFSFWTRYWTFVSDTTQCLGWLRIHWDQASMGQRLKDCQDPDKLSSPGPGLATANHCLLYCKSAGRGDTDPTFHCEDFLVAFIGSKAHSGPALSSIHFIVTFTARSVKLIGARQGALDISYPILWLAANTGNYIKIRDNQSNDYTLITAILMIIIIITLPSSELLAGITQGELSALCLFESWSWWMGGEGEETGATGHIISAADHWYRTHIQRRESRDASQLNDTFQDACSRARVFVLSRLDKWQDPSLVCRWWNIAVKQLRTAATAALCSDGCSPDILRPIIQPLFPSIV